MQDDGPFESAKTGQFLQDKKSSKLALLDTISNTALNKEKNNELMASLKKKEN